MVSVTTAAELWDGTSTIFQQTLAGSHDPEVETLLGQCVEARAAFTEIHQTFGQARDRVQGIITRLRGEGGPASPPPLTSPAATPPPASRTEAASVPLPVDRDRVEQVRGELRRSPNGAQTTGWWLHQDGSRKRVLSGPDTDPNGQVSKAESLIRGHLPPQLHGAVSLARHVEVKVAMQMRECGATHEVVVIDKEVCGRTPRTADWIYTCDKYLPFFLPMGTTLTVIEHDGTRVDYSGRGP